MNCVSLSACVRPRFSMQSRRPLYETFIASSYDHTWGCRPKKVFQKYTNLYIFWLRHNYAKYTNFLKIYKFGQIWVTLVGLTCPVTVTTRLSTPYLMEEYRHLWEEEDYRLWEEEEEEEDENNYEWVRCEDFVKRFDRFIKARESQSQFFTICDDVTVNGELENWPVAEIYVRFIQRFHRFTIAKITTFEDFRRRGIARRIVRLTKELCALHGCTARFESVNNDIMASLLRSESFKAVDYGYYDCNDYEWQASS